MTSDNFIASLSLDLDNKWSYLKTHGDPGWESLPSYLDILVPRVLEFLRLHGLRITFFVVGQDAAVPGNHYALKAITAAGHEIGNHSFSHEPWLNLYSKPKVAWEIASTEEHIANATGERPIGFRGPGFSLSKDTLEVLAERHYLYDASTFPTFIGPLARSYYFMKSHLNRDELKQRQALFGSFRDGLQPLKPYRWTGTSRLLEIPVTTMPILRLPIHLSYILYLAEFSRNLALAYFRAALFLCSMKGLSPSLLLHPLDFLGEDDRVGLQFFPAMTVMRKTKLSLLREALDIYCSTFRVVSMREHAIHIAGHQQVTR